MRVLLVKTSSLGDILHTFPALSDASLLYPQLQLDWLVEESFAQLPQWHAAVDQVHCVALRRWRRRPWDLGYRQEWLQCRQTLRQGSYDLLVDAQGLLKSAWLCRQVGVASVGYDRPSAREGLASLAYARKIRVDRGLHAIERSRYLLAAALGYEHPHTPPDYGSLLGSWTPEASRSASVLFLHGSARDDKLWPEERWVQLAQRLLAEELRVTLPWGTDTERLRAQRIAREAPGARVLEHQDLAGMKRQLLNSRAVVAVDTGLGHLAAALGVPSVSLYGRSSTALVGTRGERQRHVQAGATPGAGGEQLMASITPGQVWQQLRELLPLRSWLA